MVVFRSPCTYSLIFPSCLLLAWYYEQGGCNSSVMWHGCFDNRKEVKIVVVVGSHTWYYVWCVHGIYHYHHHQHNRKLDIHIFLLDEGATVEPGIAPELLLWETQEKNNECCQKNRNKNAKEQLSESIRWWRRRQKKQRLPLLLIQPKVGQLVFLLHPADQKNCFVRGRKERSQSI